MRTTDHHLGRSTADVDDTDELARWTLEARDRAAVGELALLVGRQDPYGEPRALAERRHQCRGGRALAPRRGDDHLGARDSERSRALGVSTAHAGGTGDRLRAERPAIGDLCPEPYECVNPNPCENNGGTILTEYVCESATQVCCDWGDDTDTGT